MNPLTNVKNITKLNQIELERGTVDKKSWHDIYKESAWIFIGGLAYGLTEGDVLSVFSQYGEIVNVNLVRDKKTGKTKGFCFLCYANQKSTVLAVDNFNGIKVCGRTIRVDHVANYKPPKENENEDDITKLLKAEGCAPRPIKVESAHEECPEKRKIKKVKKEKKKHKKHKKKDIQPEGAVKEVKVKKEKFDPGYAKYEVLGNGKLNQKATRGSASESSSDESSDGYSRHTSNQGSAKSKAMHQVSGLQSGSDGKADEQHNRSKTSAHSRRDVHDVKRRHDSSSSDESAGTKKPHRTSSFKSERSESLMHQPSVSFTMNLHLSERTSDRSKSFASKADEYRQSKSDAHLRKDIRDVKRRHDSSSSDESHRHRTSLQSKSKDSRKCDRSVSPPKDKYYSKHSHQHTRRDSSSSEIDTYRKHRDKEGEKSDRKQSDDGGKKDPHHEKHRDYGSSSNKEYYNSDKKSKRSYKNGNSSPDPNRNKSHKLLSKSGRVEREK